MAYHPCRCSITLLCPIYISVFCTPLALSVLLPFMLSAPYPFNAPFLNCSFLLLCYASLYTLEFSYIVTTTPISSLFHTLIVPVLLVHAIFPCLGMLTPPPISSTSRVLFPDHHNSSSSLVVPTMHLASLGVLLRFLNLSSS
jgi:hypothetical protein